MNRVRLYFLHVNYGANINFLLPAQVELYTEYDTKMLLPFLRSSQHYTLEKVWKQLITSSDIYMYLFLENQIFGFVTSGLWNLPKKRSVEGASLHPGKDGKLKTSPSCYY